ncbi:MAG: low molecular weight protein-tyrosine-phosphatase [Mycobacterium sp.]
MTPPLHVTFICSGNICRSPMAEKMFAHQISQRGLSGAVQVSSAGTNGWWHTPGSADPLTARVLADHGYPTRHRVAQVNPDHLRADLLVAMGAEHVRLLTEKGVPAQRIRILRSFDPRPAVHGLDVANPHQGAKTDFEKVFAVIETALPGLHAWIDAQLTARTGTTPLSSKALR